MTGKRSYRLGKRKASVEETRRRILIAASEEYRLNGIEDTSMQAVARRADVAPGTVLYHYPTPDELAEAVVESWIADLDAPSPESIDPGAPLADRIRTLVEELFGLYERSEYAYQAFVKSPHHPAMEKANDWWEENVGAMLDRALGKSASTAETMEVLAALINPSFRGSLIGSGLSSERAVEVATELAVLWLTRKQGASA
jgi:TetR/AcrR family transcriptional regulator